MTTAVEDAVRSYTGRVAPQAAKSVGEAARRVPQLRARLERAGLDAESVEPTDLARLPYLSKDEVIDHQRAHPPFGGMVAPEARIERIFQSPGPLHEPQLAGPDPWRWRPALAAVGIGEHDTVLNCFGYHLSPAGAMFELGCLAAGARVIPGGVGNQDLQVQAIAEVGVTAYIGLPSYLNALIARFDEAGQDPERWLIRRALVTAEPLPDSLRAALQRRVDTVLMAYGTAEVGLIGYESVAGEGLVPAEDVLVEVCDLDTGRPLTDGEGEVVVTLIRPDYPLVRFGTGDLSAWTTGPDGSARLVGVLGRSGQAVKVRGMFLHPRQATAALAGTPGLADWRLVIDRVDHRDELTCEIVAEAGAEAADLARRVADRIRDGLRFSATVTSVAALPGQEVLVDRRSWE